MTDTLDVAAALVLHELDAELPQECDILGPCSRSVEWEVTCRLCKGYGYLCSPHARECAAKQRRADQRAGQTCNSCGDGGLGLLIFTPVRSRDAGKLW